MDYSRYLDQFNETLPGKQGSINGKEGNKIFLANLISDICHKEGEPVFITRNGQGDLVVMSIALYEKMEALLELYRKLTEAEAEAAAGARTKPHNEVINALKERVNE